MERIQYPDPQCVRRNWVDLNGTWDFAIPGAPAGTKNGNQGNNAMESTPETLQAAASMAFPEFDRTIEVPYSYTFPKSGVDEPQYHPVVWYRRSFDLDMRPGKRYLLNFEAVDYACDVWLNGRHVGSHQGGHTPIRFDVTPYAAKENELVVKVIDFNRTDQPLGKQAWKDGNFACWYTRTIGIWQSVWLEETGDVHLTDFTMTPHANQARLDVDASLNVNVDAELDYNVTFEGKPVTHGTVSFTNARARFSVEIRNYDPSPEPHPWTPSTPDLYDIDFTVRSGGETTDEVSSYFGLRDVTSDGKMIFLNDQKYYMKLLLNQGYYPGGGLTGTAVEFRADIEKMKAMGFNGNRIHQKLESNRMLYLCDKLGFIVWAEMPSAYEFGPELIANVERELPAYLRKHVNHPSVFAYVLMNESWGVFDIAHSEQERTFVNSLYYQAKAFDPSRLVIGNDGYEQTRTDIATIHDYNADADELLETYQGRRDEVLAGAPSPMGGRRVFCQGYEQQRVPVMVTEYGGVAYEPGGHTEDSWGYGERITDPDKVVDQIAALTRAVMDIDYCVGFCYTQTSDVEQEVNGLLDHDHEYKFDPKRIREVLLSKHTYGYVQV